MPNQRLEYLFSRQFNRTISPEERDELLALIDDPAQDEHLRDLIMQVIEETGAIVAMPEESARAILLTILGTQPQQLRAQVRQPKAEAPVVPLYTQPRSRKWISYAAAAVLLFMICAGAWYTFFRQPPNTSIPAQNMVKANDVAPGGNRAMLILGNGSRIILDSAQNGVLAQQGRMQVVKLGSGQLTYTANSGKAGAVYYNTMTTPRGGEYQLTLPDGTRVWLNAASSITYPTAFTGPERKVTVTGEAYLEVAQNVNQPFKVTVAGTEIAVLGTSFNINAYLDESTLNTTLVEGKVKVSTGTEGVVLHPGGQAQVTGTRDSIRLITHADLDQALAWKNGRFAFHDADLQTVMRQLARWYDVEVAYEGNIPHREFNGKIGKTLTLDQVLKILTKARVHYTIEPNRYLIIRP